MKIVKSRLWEPLQKEPVRSDPVRLGPTLASAASFAVRDADDEFVGISMSHVDMYRPNIITWVVWKILHNSSSEVSHSSATCGFIVYSHGRTPYPIIQGPSHLHVERMSSVHVFPYRGCWRAFMRCLCDLFRNPLTSPVRSSLLFNVHERSMILLYLFPIWHSTEDIALQAFINGNRKGNTGFLAIFFKAKKFGSSGSYPLKCSFQWYCAWQPGSDIVRFARSK
ncbi:unnamed protein product [Cylicocyclus nassatus]|uniref:Uncharacterized protein n=1 Tax=Cylicocyclus nassatus TaxID=53992 RepID=A0AA36GGV2_CYLNA|nr:unnamed protein product [Cylicocyclus nassatus]